MGCCVSSSHKGQVTKNESAEKLSPLDLLKIRLARGEVSFEEYEKIKAELVK